MAVGGGVAVTGEVLRHADHARVPESAHERRALLRREERIVREGAKPDDGIFGIAVHIDNGGKIYMDTESIQLVSDEGCGGAGVGGVADRSERHIARHRAAASEPRDTAALLIDRKQELRTIPDGICPLHRVGQAHGLFNLLCVFREEDHTTEAAALQKSAQGIGKRRDGSAFIVLQSGHQHLRELFLRCHRGEKFGAVILCGGADGCEQEQQKDRDQEQGNRFFHGETPLKCKMQSAK